jgi:hypothetical protein
MRKVLVFASLSLLAVGCGHIVESQNVAVQQTSAAPSAGSEVEGELVSLKLPAMT